MNNKGICKYCNHQILWVDRKPFELDAQTRHTFDLCAQTRKANKSAKQKQVRLDQKKSLEGLQAQFPIGSYIITYRNIFPEKARYVPVGLVVAHTKFKSKRTLPLVVKRIGHGDYEDEISSGGKVVTKERYEEVLKAEIDHFIAETIAIGRNDKCFEGKLYLRTTNLVDGSPKDLSEPWSFWDRLWVETAKNVLQENNKKQAENNACQAGSNVVG